MHSSKTTRRVIDSLLYPAFLGNMSYVALEKLFNSPSAFSAASASLVVALLLHYVMDWAYNVSNATDAPYYHLKFLADCVIVVCLYVAVRLSLQDNLALFQNACAALKQPAFWLVLTKVCAVLWEVVEVRCTTGATWTKTKLLAVGIDGGGGLVYGGFLLAALASPDATALYCGVGLAAVVLVDALLYPLHDYARRKWNNA